MYPGFTQGMSVMLVLSATPYTEAFFNIIHEEGVGVPNIANIFNVTSAKDMYGLTNGVTTNYKPGNFVPFRTFLVRIVIDTIVSSREDTKYTLLNKLF